MAIWITDRTQADVDRVNELHDKANVGTWTEEERIEWAAGMKGALSYMDYNRIESGVSELAGYTWRVCFYQNRTGRWKDT